MIHSKKQVHKRVYLVETKNGIIEKCEWIHMRHPISWHVNPFTTTKNGKTLWEIFKQQQKQKRAV